MERGRALATILFTDIVGSTVRAAELGDRRWRELLARHDLAIRRELRRFGGREVKRTGDGFLALFDQPARAILCATAVRDAIRESGIEIRCGIHMGAIERADGDVGGIGVHIASRVMAEAGPGEVLISRTVRDAESGSEIEFEEKGVVELKGVPGQWRLYRVVSVPASAGIAASKTGLLRRPAIMAGAIAGVALLGMTSLYLAGRSGGPDLTPEEAIAADAAPGIAVLPFTVNDPDLATWREGMVDLMTVNLDGVPGLRPIASRTVLARWRSEVPDVADLGASLLVARRTGARYALIGSAVAVGGEVRFSADVYDARKGELLGSAQAQGSPDSVLALVDRLALGVVRELPQGKDGVLPRVRLEDVTTASLPALKSFLEGEALLRRGNLEGAQDAYERAVSADSTFALALLRIGLVCGWQLPDPACRGEYFARGMALLDRLPPRTATLLRAAQLDEVGPLRELVRNSPDDAEAWYMLGESYEHAPGWVLIIDRQEEAERAFNRAIELDPEFAMYYWHPIGYAFQKADSARAFSLVETLGRLAPGSEGDRASRLALALGFGDSASRGRALASLDTVETRVLFGATGYLSHPSHLPITIEGLRIARDRPDAAWFFFHFQLTALAELGQFDAAMEVLDDVLDDPAVRPWARKLDLFSLYLAGMDLSSDQLAREFALTKADTTSDGAFAHLHAGVLAADQGRWGDHEAVLGRAHGEVRRRRAVGDTTAARMFDGVARALQGYAVWKRGQPAEALPQLEAVQRDMRGSAGGFAEENLNDAVRWWLGQLLVELDRPRDALVYFRTPDIGGGWRPFQEFEAAKIYEELGEFEKARESYEYVLLAWRDADPELRPRIEAARQGLARLPKLLHREGP